MFMKSVGKEEIKRLFLAGIGKNTYLCIRKRKKSLPIT